MPTKILVIDDDPATTDLISLLLNTRGFGVIAANSGEEGIKLFDANPFDIIVLDLMMPGMDGWDVCRKIRGRSQIPVLILSALDNPANVASALDAGADDYLVKPVASGMLIAHINNLTRRADMNEKKGTTNNLKARQE
ncbi:MAG: response regulator [Chloroflexota bacterium]